MRTALAKRQLLQEDTKENPLVVRTMENHLLPGCQRFKYLGTTIAPRRGMNVEIRRRAGQALTVITDLKKVWRSKCTRQKLKVQLFHSLVLSILFYNAETGAHDKYENGFLKRTYMKLIRTAFGKDKARNIHR